MKQFKYLATYIKLNSNQQITVISCNTYANIVSSLIWISAADQLADLSTATDGQWSSKALWDSIRDHRWTTGADESDL